MCVWGGGERVVSFPPPSLSKNEHKLILKLTPFIALVLNSSVVSGLPVSSSSESDSLKKSHESILIDESVKFM